MKTIFKTMTSLKLARQKQIQFEQKTGLKWDVYSTGQGMIFTPISDNVASMVEHQAIIGAMDELWIREAHSILPTNQSVVEFIFPTQVLTADTLSILVNDSAKS